MGRPQAGKLEDDTIAALKARAEARRSPDERSRLAMAQAGGFR